ncbi:MAG: hypothetical protein Ct9H300mP13_4690 [Gammaproteobacteria bacterium]|nr:MAG: hypothetical protein Ct9H300mP13_4690 [Gammaproteobacteria bacterium]
MVTIDPEHMRCLADRHRRVGLLETWVTVEIMIVKLDVRLLKNPQARPLTGRIGDWEICFDKASAIAVARAAWPKPCEEKKIAMRKLLAG